MPQDGREGSAQSAVLEKREPASPVAYDSHTRTWFTPCGAEAPTLRGLLALLPPGTRLEGVYLHPERAPRTDWGPMTRYVPAPVTRPRIPPNARGPGRRPSVPGRADRVLDAWAAGDSAGVIAAREGCPAQTIHSIVQSARKRGDSRAQKRRRQ